MTAIKYSPDRLWAAGLLLCNDAREAPSPEGVVWGLTCEAARTLASLPPPPRRGYPGKSAWPDFRDEADDFFAVLRERISDGIDGEHTRIRIVPSAAAVDRCDAMWHLWAAHGSRMAARRDLIRAVWAYAGGARYRKIKATTGLSRYRLMRAKADGCEKIAGALNFYLHVLNEKPTVEGHNRARCA